MSAASESAASPSPCACTNISLMQLFHELKQKFPGVPDHVVSNTIELYCHDKHACETHLHSEAKASLTHAYHASSSAAARQLNEIKVEAPLRCRNQPLVKHEVCNSILNNITCPGPQQATLSIATNHTEDINGIALGTDANQNVVDKKNPEQESSQSLPSPVTIINIDNCVAKYCTESPSDQELSHDSLGEDNNSKTEHCDLKDAVEPPESINYKILKSNKIKYNLHEKLDKTKDKKTINKTESSPQPELSVQEKPKRPCTLEFVKPNPDIAFKQTYQETNNNDCRTISPAPSAQKPEVQPNKETTPGGTFWPERGYPLNLSVNVNCHMDIGRGYSDPWLEEFESPRVASLNLTVCTPTSNMASPVRERREDDGGFEGHFTVTVSPNSVRPPPRRRAPPPPSGTPVQPLEQHRTTRTPIDPTIDRSLIERQKVRLGQLVKALEQERGRLRQLALETAVMTAPVDAAATSRLRDDVHGLREQCDSLVKQLEANVSDTGSFYSNIYTGQRPTSQRVTRAAPAPPAGTPWQCHMCTFRNHPLLDKCEECDMPRILVGTSLHDRNDSGFGSLRINDSSRQSVLLSQIKNSTLLNSGDLPERQANSACV